MTVQQDVQKAVAAAESAQGSYLMFSQGTQDQSAKQMFQTMADDMQRHIDQLNGRLTYLTQSNPLNQQQQQQQQQQQ
jgi:rubrerythrin